MADDIEEDGGDVAGQHDAEEPPAQDDLHNEDRPIIFNLTDSHGVVSNDILFQIFRSKIFQCSALKQSKVGGFALK